MPTATNCYCVYCNWLCPRSGRFGADKRDHTSRTNCSCWRYLITFLIGLNLQPQKLLAIFQKTALLTMSTSLLFALVATTFALLLQFSLSASLLIGAAMMFSSTVVGLKLVPTTTLHHKRTGEVMTGVLLLQDLLTILLILLLSGGGSEHPIIEFGLLLLKFIALGIALFSVFAGRATPAHSF